MRLDYDSILQQTFNNSFRGYSKEEVQDYLRLVANDFKHMKQELERLQGELIAKDRRNRDLIEENAAGKARHSSNLDNMRSVLKEKARQFVSQAREKADQHKRKIEAEVTLLQDDIRHLKEKRQHLMDNLKSAAPASIDRRIK